MLASGVTLYQLITPYHELDLIRSGNTAAAVSLSGAILGLALPLAFCMAGIVSVWDIIVWGVLALIIQLLAYRIGDALLKGLPSRIEAGEMGAAALVAAIKLAVAMINSAAIAG
jgi:putative membrane protein